MKKGLAGIIITGGSFLMDIPQIMLLSAMYLAINAV